MPKSEKFSPTDHMISWESRKKLPNGQYATVTIDYLTVAWRIVWFRTEHPEGVIETELLTDPSTEVAVVRATASFYDEQGNQVLASGLGRQTPKDWRDFMEKAETRAIGRALAALGYGTQFAEEFGDVIADAPVEREAAPGASNGSKAGKSSKTAPKKPTDEYPASYKPLKTTGDKPTDAINIMERVEAAENLRALSPIIHNARMLEVLEDSDVSGAIVLKLTDAMEKIGNKDVLKSIDAVASSAGVTGLGVYRDTYKATIERLQQES